MKTAIRRSIPRKALPDLFRSPYFILITYKIRKGERGEISKPFQFHDEKTMREFATRQLKSDRVSCIPVIAAIDLCAYDHHGPYIRETMK